MPYRRLPGNPPKTPLERDSGHGLRRTKTPQVARFDLLNAETSLSVTQIRGIVLFRSRVRPSSANTFSHDG